MRSGSVLVDLAVEQGPDLTDHDGTVAMARIGVEIGILAAHGVAS